MARISGVNIPNEKKLGVSLTYIFGIGATFSKEIVKKANVDENKRVKDLSEEEIERIRRVISKDYEVEGDLRGSISQNIKRIKDIQSYRGLRHMRNLPVRGQRTKTNARTKRGKKVTVGSGRKTSAQKT